MPQTLGPPLSVGGYQIDYKVLSSIQDASRKTGISFAFLMAQAGRESAFNAQAGNRRSSASGLYQFTESTWLQLVKRYGAEHGCRQFVDKIKATPDGEYEVADPTMARKILDLRHEPGLAAVMAGEYANHNRVILEDRLGRQVTPADLYLAHFLGPQGAGKFLKAMEANPRQVAADFVPTAAELNPRVFTYRGRPADLGTVYNRIRGMLENQRHYTHLEKVPAWEASWTENISRRPQFAAAGSAVVKQMMAPVEEWTRQWSDEIERPPATAPVEDWVAGAADAIEPGLALANAAPHSGSVNAAAATRRLSEVATLVKPASAALANGEPPAEEPARTGFHALWLSLFGRNEI